ncbi:MAG TPA: hydroxysqualene dehydroxylase HpnE [Acidobacteriaceae bacterium]|nr:hydroxysqualene dehydroxylase HpnE [Acidobacteriaceae bacterium]
MTVPRNINSKHDPRARTTADVAVVGGGLAGLAAATVLADSGYHVHLIERRPYVGGRASSYEHPGTGEVIDNCQHLLLGACTNLIAFYEKLGLQDRIRWFDRFTFLEPGGRRTHLAPGILPAPFHNSSSFMRAHAFTMADKAAIGRVMLALLPGVPEDSSENFGDWLMRQGQTAGAIERFWKPLMNSALNDDLDRLSIHYAAKVIRTSFMSSPRAGQMGFPTIPLSDLYGHAIGYIEQRGGEVNLRTSAEAVNWNAERQRWDVRCAEGTLEADFVVVALPFEGMQKLLSAMPQCIEEHGVDIRERLQHFQHSPITGIHLWFDRKITDMEHAVLLDTTIQWMFNKTLLQPEKRARVSGDYLELVVSASKTLVNKSRQEIIDLALLELAQFFPAVRDANLVKAAVVKEVRATFCVTPGLDVHRPGPVTGWPGLFLAGDWTATGWPSTMEGAVRSGYLAAEALTQSAGEPQSFLHPDLQPTGLMRLLR